MHSRGHRVLRHLLPWVEGISLSVVLVCLVSIGILMGWIPIAIHSPGDNTAAASLPGRIGGATGEAVAGNDIEERMSWSKSYPTTDPLHDGSTRVPGATGPAQ